MLRTALLFSALFVIYDAFVALMARWIGIAYNSFLVPMFVLFFFLGIYAGRKKGSWVAITPIAIAAAVEATVGWYVAALIGPGYVPGWTMRALIVIAVESAALSTAVGAAGVAVGLRVARARRTII
jgi:hypothetical protein